MKKQIYTTLLLALIGWSTTNAQVGIGTTDPHPSAALQLESDSQGFLPPRMAAQPSDPSPGLVIYNTSIDCLEFYNGTDWINMCAGGSTGPTAVYCNGGPTPVVEIESVLTNRIWMDRNLGAAGVAMDEFDTANGIGDFYQWGRFSDGHQCIGAPTHNIDDAGLTKATTADPLTGADWDGKFIISTIQSDPKDWLDTRDDNLWQGVDGVNNPCPAGFRLPTTAEYQAELDALATAAGNPFGNATLTGMFNLLKMISSNTGTHGERLYSTGILSDSFYSVHWTSTVSTTNPGLSNRFQMFSGGTISNDSPSVRALGMQVRCIKHVP